jgi:hypothetical protein
MSGSPPNVLVRVFGTVDLYAEQHYGMINPDRRIRDQLDRGLGLVLDAAGVTHEYRSGGVVRGAEYPRLRSSRSWTPER